LECPLKKERAGRFADPQPVKYGNIEPMQKYNFVKTKGNPLLLKKPNPKTEIGAKVKFPLYTNKEICPLQADRVEKANLNSAKLCS
jgi:hypothetical protein